MISPTCPSSGHWIRPPIQFGSYFERPRKPGIRRRTPPTGGIVFLQVVQVWRAICMQGINWNYRTYGQYIGWYNPTYRDTMANFFPGAQRQGESASPNVSPPQRRDSLPRRMAMVNLRRGTPPSESSGYARAGDNDKHQPQTTLGPAITPQAVLRKCFVARYALTLNYSRSLSPSTVHLHLRPGMSPMRNDTRKS